MTSEEKKALTEFNEAMTKLAHAFKFLREHNGAVSATSKLATDDLIWPHHPTSQVAWQAMVSAGDHLDLMQLAASLAPDKVFLTAPFSVARSALIASSQALWILGPDSSDVRQQRALSIAIEYLTQRIGYQIEQLKVCSPEQKVLSQGQIDDLLTPMRNEALALAKKGYGYTDTRVIEAATRLRFTDSVENSVVTSNLIWRRMGGDAHSLGWQLLLGEVKWDGSAPADQLSTAAIRGDLPAMLEASLWSATLLRAAVQRFQHLSDLATGEG